LEVIIILLKNSLGINWSLIGGILTRFGRKGLILYYYWGFKGRNYYSQGILLGTFFLKFWGPIKASKIS